MVVNSAGSGEPDFAGVGVVDDVQQGMTQAGDIKRLLQLAGNLYVDPLFLSLSLKARRDTGQTGV